MAKAVKFNPVKEDTSGKIAKRMIWSTEAVNMALKGLEQGRRLVANPFYENNTKLLKGDLVFQRTPEEIAEWKRCENDIIYFANTYCKLMTPKGVRHIELRDYQEKYLQHLMDHRLSIMISPRQAGKCLLADSLIKCRFLESFWQNLNRSKQSVGRLTKYFQNNYYIKEGDYYDIPLFEIINVYKRGDLRWKIEYNLYKLLYSLKKWKREKEKEANTGRTGKKETRSSRFSIRSSILTGMMRSAKEKLVCTVRRIAGRTC